MFVVFAPLALGADGTEDVADFSRNLRFTLTAVKRLGGAPEEDPAGGIKLSPDEYSAGMGDECVVFVGCGCIPVEVESACPDVVVESRGLDEEARLGSEVETSLDMLANSIADAVGDAFADDFVGKGVRPEGFDSWCWFATRLDIGESIE